MTKVRRGACVRAAGMGLGMALLLMAATTMGVTTVSSAVAGGGQGSLPPDDEPMEPPRELAELRYRIGIRVVFTIDEGSREFGMVQQGQNEDNGPLVHGDVESLLATYLAITPRNVPVPELLLAEGPPELAEKARATRQITTARVGATDLDLAVGTAPPIAAAQGCFDTYLSWWDWHDPAAPGMAPVTYYSSAFSGKRRYSDSYVANCTPSGSPSWLWVKHRVYYKDGLVIYRQHFDTNVAPGHLEVVHKGSLVKRYRRVAYSDGWDSHPNCGGGITCKYTREGRFHD